MSFLDDSGLAYFYSKLKEKFVRSVNTITPDSSGNVTINNVATADNLTSPDGQTSYGTYIYRTSGGDISLESGAAELLYIDGNISISGRVTESFSISATNGITVEVTNKSLWRASEFGSQDGTHTFNYTASTNTWSPSLSEYGLTASGIVLSSVTASVSGNITAAEVAKATWETQITTSGTYYFVYSNSESSWIYDGTNVTLATYGITITGTPADGDIITITYTANTGNSVATVTYVKGQQGTITCATPSTFSATGFNQWNPVNVLSNYGIDNNNTIIQAAGSYLCYCKAVGGVDNGYVAYSRDGYIENIAWCASIPEANSTVVTAESVTNTLASISFNNDGYVVVQVSNTSNLCIHPKWSGREDTTQAAYVSPSVITLPTTGKIDGVSQNLPLATYGMPAIGSVADRMNLDAGVYIQNIGVYPYSAANLATVVEMDVDYDYDSQYIYYVLNMPITYTITVDPSYIVNDFGTEEFTGTSVPVTAQTLYGQNLRDKLRLDVELKKLLFTNVYAGTFSTVATCEGNISAATINADTWNKAVNYVTGTYVFTHDGSNWTLNSSSIGNNLNTYGITYTGTAASGDIITVVYSFAHSFVSDTTYSDYPYRASLSLTGVTNTMIPIVIFGVVDAASGIYAPACESYNGGIYIYASEIPSDPLQIPTIMCFRAGT